MDSNKEGRGSLQANSKTLLEELKKLPIFKMSLGSKELFHSNFLEFLWEIDNDGRRFVEMINRLLSKKSQKLEDGVEYKLSREKENFDICLYHQRGQGKIYYDLIIENKVKSIPRKDQLDDYETKVKNRGDTKFLLLSLVEEFPCLNDISNWCVVSYMDLCRAIEDVYKGLDVRSQQYINDYCDFIRKMHELQKKLVEDFKNQDYFNKEVLDEYKRLRLHDLYIKLRGSLFLSELSVKIGNAKVHIMPFNNPNNKNRSFKYEDIRDYCSSDSDVHVFLECTIQQGNGMVAAYIYKKRCVDFIYEIAIQHDQYRHGINSKDARYGKIDDEGLENVWKVVYKKDSSFFDKILKKNTYPEGSYNKYKPEYVYKYVKIENESIGELLNAMANDIEDVVKNKMMP